MPTDDTAPGYRPAVIHLIGYPGVGKYTVAREIVRLADQGDRRVVLVDNHLTSNVVFSVLPVASGSSTEVPRAVWDRVDDVRAVLRATIRDLSPEQWSFVFTNVALEGDGVDLRSVTHVRELAEARHSHYVPVRLHCDSDEHLRRVVRPERAERLKWTNAEAVRSYSASAPLIEIEHPSLLDVDVTTRSAETTAAIVLDHIAALGAGGRADSPG